MKISEIGFQLFRLVGGAAGGGGGGGGIGGSASIPNVHLVPNVIYSSADTDASANQAAHGSTTDTNNDVYDAGNPPKRRARAQNGSNSASGSTLQPRPLMLRPGTASEQHADADAAATVAGGGGGRRNSERASCVIAFY